MSDVKAAVIAHLKLLEEWDVLGFSADPDWTRRQEGTSATTVDAEPESVERPSMPRPSATHSRSSDAPPTSPAGVPESASTSDPRAALDELQAHIGECTRCKLHTLGRTHVVFGVGNPRADLMFVGEAPGRDEDAQGFPFVGRAGQLLTKIIEAMEMRREDVYIANVIKCRPPGNRNPEADEVATCEPFLFRQIDIIQPRVIVALGTFAVKTLLETTDSISRLRGRTYSYRGVQLVPTYHPAFLLRSPGYKRETWEDMKRVMALLTGQPAAE